jgi:hypothetical protein
MFSLHFFSKIITLAQVLQNEPIVTKIGEIPRRTMTDDCNVGINVTMTVCTDKDKKNILKLDMELMTIVFKEDVQWYKSVIKINK